MKKIVEIWLKKYRLHLLIWVLFIFYESVVIGLISGVHGHPLTYLAHYLIIIFLFYLHADRFLPWALKGNRNILWKVPFILTVETVSFILVSFFTDQLLIRANILHNNGPLVLNFQYSLKTLFREIYFIGFATGYYFLITYTKEKRKTGELEKQRLKDIIYQQIAEQELTKAQNAFLKAQINPHFLFNTLDFVYHNIESLSPSAADAIITLAEMMRFAIDADKMGDFIRLGDEIDQVENLLYLNQVRKNHALGFGIEYQEEVRELFLIPLVLLTLVENVLKHGSLTEEGHDASVNIYLKNETFFIATDNLVNDYQPNVGSHMGLSNIEQRLIFAYGEDVLFSYQTDESNHFRVLLSIPLKQLRSPDASSVSLTNNGKGRLHDSADQ